MLVSLLTPSAPSGSNADTTQPAENQEAFNTELQDIIEKTNAPILRRRIAAQKQQALAQDRIQAVGILQFAQDQQEVQRILAQLRRVQSNAPDDMRGELQTILDHFEETPPANASEMFAYMADYVDGIGEDAPQNLRERMEDVTQRVAQALGLMEMLEDDDDEKKQKSV